MISLEYARFLLGEAYGSTADPEALLVIYGLRGLPHEPDVPGQIIPLDQDLIRIGRQSCCWVQIKEQYISRIHGNIGRFSRGEGVVYWLRDGDVGGKPSANGIFVNGERLQVSHELADRDWIQLGSRLFMSFHRVRIPTPEDRQEQMNLRNLLMETGLSTSQEIGAAEAQAEQRGQLFGEILIQKGQISAQALGFMEKIDAIKVPIQTGKHPIGEYLKAAGLVTEQQILEALQIQKRSRVYFGMTLVKQGYLPELTLDLFMRRYSYLDPASESTIAFSNG